MELFPGLTPPFFRSHRRRLLVGLGVLQGCGASPVVDANCFQELLEDRMAVERVYYQHRRGEKPPFEQVVTPEIVAAKIRRTQLQETILKERYHHVVTPETVARETARIDATSKAPEILHGIKEALGNDRQRFQRSVVVPLVVERVLRDRFAQDAALHAGEHSAATKVARRLTELRRGDATLETLAAVMRSVKPRQGVVAEQTWRTGPVNAAPSDRGEDATRGHHDESAASRGGPYANEARIVPVPGRVGGAQPTATAPESDLAPLPPRLREAILPHLQRPGDLSPVVVTPRAFQVYLATGVGANRLSTIVLTIPKRDYEAWLREQASLRDVRP